MAAPEKPARRKRGDGHLFIRTDSAGRETWYVHWRSNGRQVKRRIGPKRKPGSREGFTGTQAEAELKRIMAKVTPTPPAAGEVLTNADLGALYVADLAERNCKRAIVVAVESILRVWLVPFFADRDARGITVDDVRDLKSMMQAGGHPGPRRKGDRRYSRPVGPKSIRNYLGTLSALFNFAEREVKGWDAGNVAHRVKLPPVEDNHDIRFLEPVEVQALAAAAVDGAYQAIDRALYLTAAMTGLRQGELIALRWRDVDWTAGRVRVRQNYVLGEFGTPKSRRSTRSVPMADAVAGELERLFQASTRQDDNDLVFADPLTGGPLDKAAIVRRYRRALKAARLDETHRFHDLRHTFGTRMAAAGVPMRTLQEWLGHRDHKTTERYADYAPSAREAGMIARAFGEVAPVSSLSSTG